MIKLGPQLYTVRAFTQTKQGIEDTLKRCHEEGYETVQISGFGAIDNDHLCEILRRYEIDVCVTHSPFDRIVNDTDRLIEEHKKMNCPLIGLGSMPKHYMESDEALTEFISLIGPVAHKIKKAGLQFAYHNHNTEFQRLASSKLIFDRLIDETDPEEFFFIPDTYWIQLGGKDPARFLEERLHDRVLVCHFKDMQIIDRQPVYAEVGEGNLDLLSAFKACQKIGVKQIVIEEDDCPRDPFDCLKNSYRNLLNIAKAAGDR